MADLQRIVDELQLAIGHRVKFGSITLNFGESRVQSVETKHHDRVTAEKPLTSRGNSYSLTADKSCGPAAQR